MKINLETEQRSPACQRHEMGSVSSSCTECYWQSSKPVQRFGPELHFENWKMNEFGPLNLGFILGFICLRFIWALFPFCLSSYRLSKLFEFVNLSFTKFGMFSDIISSNIYSAPITFSSPRTHLEWMLYLLILFHMSLRPDNFPFSNIFCPCCSDWIIYIAYSGL